MVLRARNRRKFIMKDMATMPTGTMLGMGIYHLIVVAFAVLGIAASIKYLRSWLSIGFRGRFLTSVH
jgi:hypothetical protein